jgi:hypothetical protein
MMNMTLTKALTFRMFAVNEMICLWETLFPDSHNLGTGPLTGNGTVPVNLLFMDFYDGGQLFHYATCDLWGLFTSILNLPPAFREMSCRGRGGSRRGG